MNEKIEIKPAYVSNLKKICMTIGELPTSYLETMTYYEMLIWFISYIRDTLIPTINNNGEAVQELQDLYIKLEDYVNNYFDKNFPELVDDKIEELVEDGTIGNLLNNYAGLIKVYDTFVNLVADTTLSNGQKVKTLGYYSINDNGGAEYYITTSEPQSGYYEEISTGIYASILINDRINFKQLGAKRYEEDSTFDNKDIIDKYMTICNAYDKTFELFIPNGKWCFSATLLNRPKGVRIVGDKTWAYDNISGSAILPLNDNQQYVWKLGGLQDYTDYVTSISTAQMVHTSYIDGLWFSTMNGAYDTRYSVSQGVFIIDRCSFCTFDNLFLWKFSGNGLVITSSWELDFGLLSIRQHQNPETYSLLFDKTKPISNVSVNISALTIEKLYFERNDNYIRSMAGSGFTHNFINYINVETKFTSDETLWNTSEATDEEIENATQVHIFRGMCRYLTIGTINITFNDSLNGIVYNNQKYYMKSILCDDYATIAGTSNIDKQFNVDVSQIVARYSSASSLMSIIKSINMHQLSHIHIGSLSCEDNNPKILIDAYQSGNIRIGSFSSSTNAFNTSDIITDLKPAYKHGINGPHGMITYMENAPSEYNLVAWKEAESTPTGIRWINYNYSNSTNLAHLKFICKNFTEEAQRFRLRVIQSGVQYTYNLGNIVPVADGWQLVDFPFWADFGTEVQIMDYGGNIAYAGFKVE